ncbi:MAG: DUF3472 domain-containing protein [Oscillospiraceae bacterium]|nr:DUF3472 domain-containing protein [Oscillospiraceae bacterium]
MSEKNQAPNMFIKWNCEEKAYDFLSIDWRCDVNAPTTYWAVHSWNRTENGHGYAGFQTDKNKNSVIILALWNENGYEPEVEYLSSLSNKNNLEFGNEGTGKHVFTNYDWKLNTWYRMCIGVKTIGKKNIFCAVV